MKNKFEKSFLERLNFIVLVIVPIVVSFKSYGQISIDHRKFAINLLLEDRHESFDTLFFSNGLLTYATANKFGFQPAPYKTKEKKDGNIVVTATNKSKANGIVVWNFVVIQDSIAGTSTLDTPVQNPVNYQFTGKEIK